jgi:hypothetical protein
MCVAKFEKKISYQVGTAFSSLQSSQKQKRNLSHENKTALE